MQIHVPKEAWGAAPPFRGWATHLIPLFTARLRLAA
jgi:hypothetical protein